MQARMSEVEKWRSQEEARLRGKIQTIASERADIRSTLYLNDRQVVTKIPPEKQERLVELEKEERHIRQQLLEVEREAARREREPVDPGPEIRKLTGALANEKHRLRWFAHAVYVRRMEGYRFELVNITRRVRELEDEIMWIEEAEAFTAEQREKEEQEQEAR